MRCVGVVNLVDSNIHRKRHEFSFNLTAVPIVIDAHLSWTNVRFKVYLLFTMKNTKFNFLKGIHSVTLNYSLEQEAQLHIDKHYTIDYNLP
jgi:hypothetical protein